MLRADTVNLCVRVMGVSSFWQTAAQHTFPSNFQKYTSPAVAFRLKLREQLPKPVNFYSLFTAPSPLTSTGLYTHVLHINCTFFVFSFIASPSFYPSSVLSASTPLTSPPPPSPFIVSLYPNHHHPSFPFRNRMTPLPFIKLAYASDTAQAGEWGEKKGEVMWEARERSFRSTPEAHLRPSLKPGLLLLPFVSSSLFSLSTVSVHQGKLWQKKKRRKETMHKEDREFLRSLTGEEWVGFGVKSGQIIRLKQGEETLLAKHARSSDSKIPVLCFLSLCFFFGIIILTCSVTSLTALGSFHLQHYFKQFVLQWPPTTFWENKTLAMMNTMWRKTRLMKRMTNARLLLTAASFERVLRSPACSQRCLLSTLGFLNEREAQRIENIF